MLTTEEIFTLAEPFGAFQYGDAQGDKRIAFARVIEHAACEDLNAEIDRLTRERNEARAEAEALRAALERRTKQIGVACDKHDLTHALACGHCLHEARAERDAVAKLLLRAGDAIVCRADLMGEDGRWQESHYCANCDKSVDSNWQIRTEIRAALAQIEQEQPK